MSATAHPTIAMRPLLPADVPLLAEIFRASIEEKAIDDYSDAQREAWAAAADDEAEFGARLAGQLTLVGTMQGSPVGFASLKAPDVVDMLYVHPAAADDEAAFGARLAGQLTLVGTLAGSAVGFASLKAPDTIDMLYVHPAATEQGVATMLIDALEKLAAARGAGRLTADVSDSAVDFFRKRGFVPQMRNSKQLGGEWLANTTMEKKLAARERA